MSNHVFNEYSHMTSFKMEFPDGETKPAFLLTSVQKILERRVQRHHFNRLGLRDGVDYMVVGATQLPHTGPDWTSIPPRRGQRTVLSVSGLLLLTLMQGRDPLSNKVRYWIVDEVIPAVMEEGFYSGQPSEEIRIGMRNLRKAELRKQAQ